ncbi:hypothetical protein ACTJKO_07650 [Curtobacterium sp. 22159]|uniref:hypothetical protein n=1 Tax=Curtobacterium sp. 22159 TaxID=3453882 RepID=UPI003F8258D8
MTGRIHVRGQGGQVVALDLPLHPDIAKRLERGQLRRVKPDGSLYEEHERPLDAPDLPENRPALSALKPAWVGWAVKNGMPVDEAERATKDDLIEKFGVKHEAQETDEQRAAREATEAEEAAKAQAELDQTKADAAEAGVSDEGTVDEIRARIAEKQNQ